MQVREDENLTDMMCLACMKKILCVPTIYRFQISWSESLSCFILHFSGVGQLGGWDILRKSSGAGNLAAGDGEGDPFQRTPSGGARGLISRVASNASHKSSSATREGGGNASVQGSQKAMFLFWRASPESDTCTGHWVVADSPASEDAALCVESDAMDPAGIEPTAQWQFWNGTDWEMPKGAFRAVINDDKINPDAGRKKLMEAATFYGARRVEDELSELERKAELKKQRLQADIISRLQSGASDKSERVSIEDRLRGIGANIISRRPSGASGGPFSRRPSGVGFTRKPSADK